MSLYFNQTTSQQVVSLSLHIKYKLNENDEPVKERIVGEVLKEMKEMN